MTKSNGKSPVKCRSGAGCAHKLKKNFDDSKRRHQSGRFAKLELQVPMREAEILRKRIMEQVALLAAELRPRVPSVRSIAAVLGFFKSGASLSQDAIRDIELSVEEIAGLVGLSKTTCDEVLAWLGDGVVKRRGQPVARGLGLIESESRKGVVEQCRQKRAIKRTSVRSLTALGRDFLGLVTTPRKQDGTSFNRAAVREERRKKKADARERALSEIKTAVCKFHGLDEQTGAKAVSIHDMAVDASLPDDENYVLLCQRYATKQQEIEQS